MEAPGTRRSSPARRGCAGPGASALYHALMNLGINTVQAVEQKGPGESDRVSIDARDVVATAGGPLPLPPVRTFTCG